MIATCSPSFLITTIEVTISRLSSVFVSLLPTTESTGDDVTVSSKLQVKVKLPVSRGSMADGLLWKSMIDAGGVKVTLWWLDFLPDIILMCKNDFV